MDQVAAGNASGQRFYRVSQVAEITGLSEPTLYRAIRAGRFPAVRVLGCYVVPAKALDDMETSALASGLVDAAGNVISPLSEI